jgi:hypothetical protein
VVRHDAGHVVVGYEVGAGALGRAVLGCRDQELAGRVEGVGVPSRAEHALAEDQIHVFALADTEADPVSICERTAPCPIAILGDDVVPRTDLVTFSGV